jgi:hypothetical protein
MKNKRCHTVGTVLKSNRKTKDATLSEQFQHPIDKSKENGIKSVPPKHLIACHGTGIPIKSGLLKLPSW